MKRGSTLFLKLVIFLIAIAVLAFMIRFPQTEGRAKNLDLISIYSDPLILYGYIASIPFFTGLYQAFKLLGYIDKNKIFSKMSVTAMRTIKYCAIAIIGFIAPVLPFILVNGKANNDDPAGAIAMGLIVIFASIVIASTAAIFEKLLQKRIKK
jgi:hypothetical protein